MLTQRIKPRTEQKCCQGQLGNTLSKERVEEVHGEHLVHQQPLNPQTSGLTQELHPSAGGSRRALAAQEALGGGSIAL